RGAPHETSPRAAPRNSAATVPFTRDVVTLYWSPTLPRIATGSPTAVRSISARRSDKATVPRAKLSEPWVNIIDPRSLGRYPGSTPRILTEKTVALGGLTA